jgi:hypothetical protein
LREKGRADAKVREFDRLAGVVYLKHALEAEKKLYPAWPHKIADMQRWLDDDAGQMLRGKPEINKTMAALRARARDSLHHMLTEASTATKTSVVAAPLCQRQVRQLPLDISVVMGGEWCPDRAETHLSSWS